MLLWFEFCINVRFRCVHIFYLTIITLSLKKSQLFVNRRYHFRFSTTLGLVLLLPLLFLLSEEMVGNPVVELGCSGDWRIRSQSKITLVALGSVLYTEYAYAFIVAGVILFVGIIGVILLTIEETQPHPRQQNISHQMKRTPQTSVFKAVSFN